MNNFVNLLLEGEDYKYIPETNQEYIITNFGRVFSKSRKPVWVVLKHRLTRAGYHRVTIKGKDKYIHRLVLENFNPVKNMEKLDAGHIDDDKDNNYLDNLKWMTRLENNHWNDKIERGASKRREPVARYTMDGEFIDSFASMREAAKYLNFDHSKISKCAHGEKESYNGFKWKLLKGENKNV